MNNYNDAGCIESKCMDFIHAVNFNEPSSHRKLQSLKFGLWGSDSELYSAHITVWNLQIHIATFPVQENSTFPWSKWNACTHRSTWRALQARQGSHTGLYKGWRPKKIHFSAHSQIMKIFVISVLAHFSSLKKWPTWAKTLTVFKSFE